MIYLALSVVAAWMLSGFCVTRIGQGDDFAAAFGALIFMVLGGVLTVVYVGCAFWFHRFV